MQSSPTSKDRPYGLLIAVALLIAIVVVYSGVARCDFISFDDPAHVYKNPVVRAGLTGDGVVKAFTETHTAVWVPLTTISFMSDVSLFGLNPSAMHLENVAWHAGAAVLLFLALRRLTGRLWPSAIVAALFGLHPVNVESVAWITERKNVLCGFFFMLALYAWSWWAMERRTLGWWGAFLALAASLLAKPMAVTFPCVLLLLDFWPLQRFPRVAWYRLLLEKVPLFLLCAATSYMATHAADSSKFVVTYAQLPFPARVTNAICSYGGYLADLAMPQNLTLFYAHPRVAQWWPAAAMLTGLLVALGLALWRRREQPYLLVGLLVFLGVLVPSLGFVQVGEQARADRFVYLAETGIFIAVVWLLDATLPKNGRLRATMAVVPLAAFGVVTFNQTEHWENDLSLFRHTLEVAPMDSAMMSLWLNALDTNPKRAEAAQALIETKPRFGYQAGHWDLLGRLHLTLGNAPAAEEDFRKGLALNPGDRMLHTNLALALASRGENAGAEAEFKTALADGPGTYAAHINYATFLERLGRKQEARAEYAKALQLTLTDEGLAIALRKLDERLKP